MAPVEGERQRRAQELEPFLVPSRPPDEEPQAGRAPRLQTRVAGTASEVDAAPEDSVEKSLVAPRQAGRVEQLGRSLLVAPGRLEGVGGLDPRRSRLRRPRLELIDRRQLLLDLGDPLPVAAGEPGDHLLPDAPCLGGLPRELRAATELVEHGQPPRFVLRLGPDLEGDPCELRGIPIGVEAHTDRRAASTSNGRARPRSPAASQWSAIGQGSAPRASRAPAT